LSTNALFPHPLFNTEYYLAQLEPGERENINPLVHYLEIGAKRGFNPSPDFDGNSYLRRYPDVAAAGVNPLLHYLSGGREQWRIGRKFTSISDGVRALSSPGFEAARRTLQQSAKASVTHVIILGSLTRGGAERSACSYIKAIAANVGIQNVLVVVTDASAMTCAEWLPSGTRLINITDAAESLCMEERAILLLELLSKLQPAVIAVVHSYLFWTALDCHTEIFRSEISSQLTVYFGGYENYVNLNEWGFNDGFLSRLANFVDLFVTDTERLREKIIEQYSAINNIASKTICCYKSLTEDLHRSLSAAADRRSTPNHTIVWVGRLTKTKRPDILAKIATSMPDVQFEVYGPRCPLTDVDYLKHCPNIVICGECSDFSKIRTEDKALLLHTSESEGLPNVLLEAAAAELPIAAARVGGVQELIDDNTGWLVSSPDDVPGYVSTLQYVLEHPEIAQERARLAKLLVDCRHVWPRFVERVNDLDIWRGSQP
jgi:glycosyltransferase involved in cell wall biosynthesis